MQASAWGRMILGEDCVTEIKASADRGAWSRWRLCERDVQAGLYSFVLRNYPSSQQPNRHLPEIVAALQKLASTRPCVPMINGVCSGSWYFSSN